MPAATLPYLNTQPTISIIDEDVVCRSLSTLLEALGLKTHIFQSAAHFLEHYEPTQPGCLITDLNLSQNNGLSLQEQLNNAGLNIPVIFLSSHSNVAMAVRTLKAGAIDFIEKPFDDQRLLDSVQKALQTDQAQRNEAHWKQLALQYLDQLSRREKEVLRLLIQGKANKVVAHEMSLSTKTIETHRAHIMSKLGVSSVAGLVWMALTSGEYQEVPARLPFPLPQSKPAAFSLF
jgi:two-component system, LuxR family, response regulator FixJ